MSDNIWVLGTVCLLVGVVIGAIGYRFFAGGASGRSAERRLAERDAEIRQLRTSLNAHFARMSELADGLQRQTRELTSELAGEAERLADDGGVKRRLGLLSGRRSLEEVEEEEAASLAVPRDYADAKGTLAEDYGIKRTDEEAEGINPPPRY